MQQGCWDGVVFTHRDADAMHVPEVGQLRMALADRYDHIVIQLSAVIVVDGQGVQCWEVSGRGQVGQHRGGGQLLAVHFEVPHRPARGGDQLQGILIHRPVAQSERLQSLPEGVDQRDDVLAGCVAMVQVQVPQRQMRYRGRCNAHVLV